ncbi:universal stress protein, partial [Methylobacterium brachiatum]
GEVEPLLTLAGRVHDLVVVDRPDPNVSFTGRAPDTALFSVGRPTLMVGDTVPHDLLDHVFVAWNSSLEATRLIGQSIGLLHEATRVTVVQAQT